MSDLVLGVVVLALCAWGIFVAALRLGRRLPHRLCDALAAAVVLLIGLYIRHVWDHVVVAQWLPFSNLIVVGNWFPLGIAALAGLAWNRVPPPVLRKAVVVVLLFGAAAGSVYYPFRGEKPVCGDDWDDGVCRQTTPATCSAACAATLLRHRGIPATEQEMADLCITREGTTWWGLFRGLKLKTAGTPWDVEVVAGPATDLKSYVPDGAILFVRLTEKIARENPKYLSEGWIVGTSHSVVLFDIDEEGSLVGDPSRGMELWPLVDLETLYEGRGIRLVRRSFLAESGG